MGKHSDFKRMKHDFYPTPKEAVEPLLDFLFETGRRPIAPTKFMEPCVGEGHLVRHLESAGMKCIASSDYFTDEQRAMNSTSYPRDITENWKENLQLYNYCDGVPIITNPPWTRKILHPFLDNIIEANFWKFPSNNAYAWLLLDYPWSATKQARKYMPYCSDIVMVGRVRWFPNTNMKGKEDCAWYKFSGYRGITRYWNR